MSVKKSLKVILGENNPSNCSHEEFIKNLEGKNDEFTKYRTNKKISKEIDKIIGEVRHGKSDYNPKEQYYLDSLIQIYRKLPFEYKLILYGEAEGMLKCLE